MKASICILAPFLLLTFTSVQARASAAEYINRVKLKMKPGLYTGVNASGSTCTVNAVLGRNRRASVYSVTVDPTIENESAPAGPTVVSFSSKDPRVLYDGALERAVNSYADVYLVLGITRHSSGKTLIRAYEERGSAIRVGECLISL